MKEIRNILVLKCFKALSAMAPEAAKGISAIVAASAVAVRALIDVLASRSIVHTDESKVTIAVEARAKKVCF